MHTACRSLGGPAKKLHYGRTEWFPLLLFNAGPDGGDNHAAYANRIVGVP